MQSNPDKIQNVRELPVKDRRRTDFFCAIFITAYVILLAIILAVLHNGSNIRIYLETLAQITYPTDNSGKLCGYDYPNYPYVYYTSTTDPVRIQLSRPKEFASINVPRQVRQLSAANPHQLQDADKIIVLDSDSMPIDFKLNLR